MSDHSSLATESMKNLTERVIKADLASRKRKMIHFKALRNVGLIWIPFIAYGIYHTLHSQGLLLQVNRQAGDATTFWKVMFGNNKVPIRQMFRSEVYYQDQATKLKYYAELTAREVAKDEKVVFKPYIWN